MSEALPPEDFIRDLLATIGPNTIFVQRFGITDFINGAEIRDLLNRLRMKSGQAAR